LAKLFAFYFNKGKSNKNTGTTVIRIVAVKSGSEVIMRQHLIKTKETSLGKFYL